MTGVFTELLVIVLLLVFNGVLAMAEIAVVSARKARLRHLAERGDSGAAAALDLAEHPNRFLSTVQIGITLVGILAGAFGGATIAATLSGSLASIPALAPYAEAIGLAIVVAVITFLSLIVGELVPKRLALNAPERIAARLARPMGVLASLASPIVALLSVTTDGVLKLLRVRAATETAITEEEIRVLVAEATEAGVFEQAERELVESTFELGETHISQLMTPRPLVEWIDLDDAPDIQWQVFAQMPHLHIPLCRGDLDHVVGILAVRELVSELVAGRRPDLASRAQPPLFFPEHLSAFRALEHFKQHRPHVALVVDEHGGVAGLVTPTDILEALVGDMAPAPGEPGSGPVQRPDGSWLLDGLMPVDDLAELFALSERTDAERKRVQTLGGLIMTELSRIPTTGDRITWRGVELEVVDMDGRRVDKVLASTAPPGPTMTKP